MGLKLGDVSPMAGMMTGKGMLGEAMANGLGGAIPYFVAKDAQKDRERDEAMAAEEEAKRQAPKAFKKGGSVRGAGCAKRGVKKAKVY